MDTYEKKLKEALNDNTTDYEVVRWIEQKFPELKESEDERIRKELISFVRHLLACHDKPNAERDEKYESWIAWLEKQSEQKPAEWNKNDEVLLDETLHFIREFQQSDRCIDEGDMQNSFTCENWLKSLKDRVQPIQEWSEEDERLMKNLKSTLANLSARKLIERETEDKYVNWLKSLRPQNRWKPSDEQMEALEYYMHTLVCNHYKESLFSMYQDLKKLREE